MLGSPPHGYIWSKTLLSRSLVTVIFNITSCTRSTRVLDCGFLIVVKKGLISKPFIKGVKSHLNSDPLSNTTLCERGDLHIHELFKNWLTLEDGLSMYSSLPAVTSLMLNVSISMISNQLVEGLIIFMEFRLTLFQIIAPPGCCCLIDLLYGPINSTCTESHSFSSATFLGGRCP